MKLRKTLLALFLALLTLAGTCAAADAAGVGASAQAINRPGVASPQAEETVWCTRWHNGKQQKRLWSITHGIWLTDWIDIDP